MGSRRAKESYDYVTYHRTGEKIPKTAAPPGLADSGDDLDSEPVQEEEDVFSEAQGSEMSRSASSVGFAEPTANVTVQTDPETAAESEKTEELRQLSDYPEVHRKYTHLSLLGVLTEQELRDLHTMLRRCRSQDGAMRIVEPLLVKVKKIMEGRRKFIQERNDAFEERRTHRDDPAQVQLRQKQQLTSDLRQQLQKAREMTATLVQKAQEEEAHYQQHPFYRTKFLFLNFGLKQ